MKGSLAFVVRPRSRTMGNRRGRLHLRRFVFASLIGLLSLSTPIAAQEFTNCPNPAPTVPAVTISHQMLEDVCTPPDLIGNPIAYFDNFSWRAFLALVWPAKQEQRGKPDPALPLGAAGKPTVFETFKAEWEVFQPEGKDPAAWSKYDGANPCNVTGLVFGDIMLAAFSKFANVGMAGFGPKLTGALVAQNGTYVRYAVGFNESEFAAILAKKAYVRANLAGNIAFANGAVDIKAAWIDMKGVANPDRYHTRQAWLFDLETNTCTKTTVGLVGLHIVTKTASRPQWIWTTFEHVDNVPAAGASGPFAFNNGAGTPMPTENPIKFPIPAAAPAPYNVERVTPIHSSTVTTNDFFRQALKAAGSKWQFYQLVMTQWPREPFKPDQAGTPGNTFPGTGAAGTAFANTTMETFEQTDIIKGCMSCHNLTRIKTDYLWSVMTRAHPSILQIPAVPPPAPPSPLATAAEAAPRPAPYALPADQLEIFDALSNLLATKRGN
jgi:hypothetical protein